MNILIVGSGAREHAIAWKLASSPRLERLFCAPGNAGIAQLAECVPIKADDIGGLAAFAHDRDIDLVVVGPEIPLALGLADRLAERGIRCFGPGAAAARLESSKAFAKAFMERHGIPAAESRTFSDLDTARSFIHAAPWPFVIKCSGLAAGKGVFLPSSLTEAESILDSIMKEGSLGPAGAEVVIEERLSGEEVSILGFCDGHTVKAMPPSQDHKRLFENDSGPNTGGMGAIASAKPLPFSRARELSDIFLSPAVGGMASEGTTYIGVLYAGLMLTKKGPKALEYNCRFGDPETQALLPLLESDLAEIFEACCEGRLRDTEILWKQASSACVVVASEGYAIEPRDAVEREVKDFAAAAEPENSFVFHAATRQGADGIILASGGRLLGVSAWAGSLAEALDAAYARLARLEIRHVRWRRDVGRGKNFVSDDISVQGSAVSSYASAGVDIDAGDRAVELMGAAVKSTYGPEVLAGIGSFGGIYDVSFLKTMRDPVLVSSTDGVGTKVKLAALSGRYESVGQDIVNHCIDDILVQGARPLFFLDYIATSKLDPAMIATTVGGMAKACRESGCALIGGETAEMPGVYMPAEFDIAGAIVGLAERSRMLPLHGNETGMREGDILVGFPSSGLHTNGYSLARKVLVKDASSLAESLGDGSGLTVGDALLAPHRSYLPILLPVLENAPGLVKGLAHITGGGFEGNVPRILPSDLDARISAAAWQVPAIFRLIQSRGDVEVREMYRVFNMGIGMIAVIDPARLEEMQTILKTAGMPGSECRVVGRLEKGSGSARMEFEPV
jgi:phosphoribosylamine--glycine ligase/phosphoribosylformylglycinamidine cyclo-ligase